MTEVDEDANVQKIGLALSGGGSRAMAFHLGCLRALHNEGLLDKIATISAVSGGSVIAALYCHTPGDFTNFETETRRLLAQGFLRPALWQAITSTEGIKAVANAAAIRMDRILAFIVRRVCGLLGLRRCFSFDWLNHSPIRRHASRTTIMRRVMGGVFANQTLSELRSDRPRLIIVACELQAKSAFYFAAEGVGSWRLGTADADRIEIGDAVTASAAYPLLLPALDEVFVFTKSGVDTPHRVILTDGGVYDNLALAPLWPGRDPEISLHVDRFSRIIASRAGYSLRHSPTPLSGFSRMIAVFESIHARAQNLAISRGFDLMRSGEIDVFLLPYLDQNDEILLDPPADLVRAEEVAGYPTDFSAMSEEWIDKLVKRGEQITQTLIKQHWR